MFGRKRVFGTKSPAYQAQLAAMQPSPDADGVARVFPKQLWDDPKIGSFLRSAGMQPDDPQNIARTGDHFIAKFKAAREALNARTAQYNARMRRSFGHCNALPLLIIEQAIWDGPNGAFLYGNLDLVGYDDWNVLMMAGDAQTVEACGLAPHPGKLLALTAAVEDHIVRARARWEQAHESFGDTIMGRPGIDREEFERVAATITSDLKAFVDRCKAMTCEIILEERGYPASAAAIAVARGSSDTTAGAHEPHIAGVAPDPDRAATDAALDILSGALAMDMNIEVGRIFDPSLWDEREIANLFEASGLGPNQKWNAIALFTSKATVRTLRAARADDPRKQAAIASGIGMVPYDVGEIDGFHQGMLAFHRTELINIARSPASDKAKHYALFSFIEWSTKLYKGEIEMAIPGL